MTLLLLHLFVYCSCCVFSQLVLFSICAVCVQYLSSEYLSSSICDRQVCCSEEGEPLWSDLVTKSLLPGHRRPPPATAPDSLTTHNSSHGFGFHLFISLFCCFVFLYFVVWLVESLKDSKRAYQTVKYPKRWFEGPVLRPWNTVYDLGNFSTAIFLSCLVISVHFSPCLFHCLPTFVWERVLVWCSSLGTYRPAWVHTYRPVNSLVFSLGQFGKWS